MAITLGSTGLVFPDATTQTSKFDTGNDTGGFISIQVWTSSGTWTKPTGCRTVRVLVQGAGGGGSGHSESGGAGGYCERTFDVSGLSTVAVTVGTGGGGSNYAAGAGAGGTSSFGSYATSPGGAGANTVWGHTGGRGGLGAGGDINLYGGGGSAHGGQGTGKGGVSFFSGGHMPAGHHGGTFYTHWGESYGPVGSGGNGEYTTHSRGGNGRDGMVVVYNYS